MRSLPLLLAAGALLVGCDWDGPPRDVRVVSASALDAEPTVPTDRTSEPTAGGSDGAAPADGAPGDAAGGDAPPVRPGSYGALTMPETVAVVGDSLTVSATEEITAALARVGVRAVVVDGRESRRMATGGPGLPSGVTAIEGVLAEHRPDVWVVALGTNDVASEVAADRFVADLRATLAAVPTGAPVVWVDVWIRDRVEAVVAANELLRGELGRRRAPTLVVDWFSTAPTDGLVTGDGVHLTQAGQDRFAAEVAAAVVEIGVVPG